MCNLPQAYPTYQAPKPGTVEFAKYIDHTLLKLDATEEQIDQLCEEAKKYNFKVDVPVRNYMSLLGSNKNHYRDLITLYPQLSANTTLLQS